MTQNQQDALKHESSFFEVEELGLVSDVLDCTLELCLELARLAAHQVDILVGGLELLLLGLNVVLDALLQALDF